LPGQLVGKRAGWLAGADPSLEQLGAQAGAHADSKARGEMFQEIQRRLNQVSPIFPLIHPGQVVVASSNLTNASYNPIWYIDFAAIGTR
jgi:peptide/nickel transport system substrate-binding protein